MKFLSKLKKFIEPPKDKDKPDSTPIQVICITNILPNTEKYWAVEVLIMNENVYAIFSSNGVSSKNFISYHPKKDFISLAEWRNNQINSIFK